MTAPPKAGDEKWQGTEVPRGPTSSCAFGSAFCLEGEVTGGTILRGLGGRSQHKKSRSMRAGVWGLCFVHCFIYA